MNKMFSLDEVVAAVKGSVINRKGKTGGTIFVSAVSTDTRMSLPDTHTGIGQRKVL